MTRTILVHLNVEVPESFPKSPEEIAEIAVAEAYKALIDHSDEWKSIVVEAPLAEEV